MLVYGLPGIYAYTGYLFHYKFFVYPKIVRYLYPLSTTAQMATVYLTLTVTMERYVAVCHPLKARSLCTYGRARTALFVIAVFSILYNLPKYVLHHHIIILYTYLHHERYMHRSFFPRESPRAFACMHASGDIAVLCSFVIESC